MFCYRCGAELPDVAQYCWHCGTSQGVESTSLDPGADEQGTTETLPELSSESQASSRPPEGTPQKGVRTPYVWLSLELTIVTLLLAITLFNAAWQSIAWEAEKAGESIGRALGRVLIPIAVVLYFSARGWKSLLEQEPEANPVFKRKHRRFLVVSATCAVILLASALSFGVVIGKRIERTERIKAISAEMLQLGPKNAECMERLGAIRSTETPTMRDYHSQCLEVERLLDECEPDRQKTLALFNSMVSELTGEPERDRTFALIKRIMEVDSHVIAALRREIAKAKQLNELPHYEQEAFYDREIVPIQNEIERLVKKEMPLLREVQQQGIELPANVSGWLEQD